MESNDAQLPESAAAENYTGIYPDETKGYNEFGPFLAETDEKEAEIIGCHKSN